MSKNVKIMLGVAAGIVVICCGVLFYYLSPKTEKVEDCQSISGGGFTIIFESGTDEKFDDMSVCIACSPDSYAELPVPHKDQAMFEGWFYDKDFTKPVEGTSSLNVIPVPNTKGENCIVGYANVTLYAKYLDILESHEEEDLVFSYSCPSGYSLNGDKCLITKTANKSCADGTFEVDGKCVVISAAGRKDYIKACPSKTVHMGMGSTVNVQGTLTSEGMSYCYYGLINDVKDQQTCTSQTRKWSGSLNACYADKDQNYTTACETGFVDITNPNSYAGVNGLNSGCFRVQNITYSCEEGYVLNSTTCIKTIDATRN